MATAPQNQWNRSHSAGQRPTRGDDENSIVLKPIAGAPTCSWWIGTDEDFQAKYQRELPRITGSAMAKTLRPILLGGRLP